MRRLLPIGIVVCGLAAGLVVCISRGPRADLSPTDSPVEAAGTADDLPQAPLPHRPWRGPLLAGDQLWYPRPPGLLTRWGDARIREACPGGLALSPDGSTLATTSHYDPTVRLWDTSTGRLLWQRSVVVPDGLNGYGLQSTTVFVGFNPDGNRLVARFGDHRVVTLDARTGAVISSFDIAYGSHLYFSLSPDWTAFAGEDTDGRLAVWDLATGRKIKVFGVRAGWNTAFSPDGKRLAAFGPDGAVLCLHTHAETSGDSFRGIENPGTHDQLLWPRSDRVVVAGGKEAVSFDPGNGRIVNRRDGTFYVDNGRLISVLPGDVRVEVDADTLQPASGRARPSQLRSGLLSRNGTVGAIYRGHAVSVFDGTTRAPMLDDLTRFPTLAIAHFEFSADGRRMLTAADWHGDAIARIWNEKGEPVRIGELPPEAQYFRRYSYPRLSPNGQWVAGTLDSRLAIWDAHTGVVKYHEPGPAGGSEPDVIGYDADGHLWVLAVGSGDVIRRDPQSGVVTRTLPGLGPTRHGLVSPDGRRVAVGRHEGFAVRSTDAGAAWETVARPPTPADEFFQKRGVVRDGFDSAIPLAFSPDGRWLVTGETGWWGSPIEPRFTVWDVTSQPVRAAEWQGTPGKNLGGLTISPDGHRIAFWMTHPSLLGWGTEVVVWETATFSEVYRFRPADGLTGLRFAPDNHRLLVGHPDTTISIWDAVVVERDRLAAVTERGGEALWSALGSRKPMVALAAVHALTADPAAVRLLTDRVGALLATDLSPLLAELGDEDFVVRENATARLAEIGVSSVAALRNAAATSASAEVRARANRLLVGLARPNHELGMGHRRALRAVEVLERVGTQAARELLGVWAQNDRDGVLKAEANAALVRLAKR